MCCQEFMGPCLKRHRAGVDKQPAGSRLLVLSVGDLTETYRPVCTEVSPLILNPPLKDVENRLSCSTVGQRQLLQSSLPSPRAGEGTAEGRAAGFHAQPVSDRLPPSVLCTQQGARGFGTGVPGAPALFQVLLRCSAHPGPPHGSSL